MKSPSLRDLKLSSEELKEIAQLLARKRGIKGYESMPEDRLLNAIFFIKICKKEREVQIFKSENRRD